MRVVVGEVAQDEEGEERLDPDGPEHCAEQREQDCSRGNGGRGRHQQARRVVGILVMNAVNEELQASAPR